MSNDFEQKSFKRLPKGSEVTSIVPESVDIGDAITTDDLDELPISDRIKEIILNGHPDFESDAYAGPSEARFAAIMGMIQADVSDEKILGVLLDPQYAIHNRGKGVVTEKYAHDEIKRAHATVPKVADDFSEPVDPIWLKETAEDVTRKSRFVGRPMSFLRKLEPLTFLVEGIIPVNSLFEMYGPRKAGKTFFALDLGLSIATGIDFHGLTVRKGRVLHIIAEGNPAAIRDRNEAWILTRAKNLEDKKTLNADIEKNWRTISLPVHIDIKETLKEFLKANPGEWDLIIVDTMLRNMTGHISDPKDMAAFVQACDTIKERTKAAVLVIHHEGKDKSKGGMGSMVFDAAVDGIAKFTRQGTSAKRVFSIIVLRDSADDLPDMIFELESVPLVVSMGDDGKEEVRSAVLKFIGMKAKGNVESAADKLLLAIYQGGSKTRADLAAALSVSPQAISKTAKELRVKGYLPEDGFNLTQHGIEAAEFMSDDDEESDAED